MRGVTSANITAFALALFASTAVAWVPFVIAKRHPSIESTAIAPSPRPLRDHSGTVVASPRQYQRIVSASTVADTLLLELCEPDRVVAFTAQSAHKGVSGYKYAGKPTVDLGNVESVLALHPDLVLVNVVGDPHRVARLRDAGVVVYDLGEMRGLATLIPNIREIAWLVGHPERGERFARELVERAASVAIDIAGPDRKTGMYLSIYGGRLFGGGSGTSFDDVLRTAGLIDSAAAARDWPQFATEQVLKLDPEIIVTNAGMRQVLCEHAGFSLLRACKRPDGVVEVDEALLGDPGPTMMLAAQAIRDRVYGPPAASILGGAPR
jgi:iron complex transport system substrate-binding protein